MQLTDAPTYDFHLPPTPTGFESIAAAADEAMADVLVSDWHVDTDAQAVAEINRLCAA